MFHGTKVDKNDNQIMEARLCTFHRVYPSSPGNLHVQFFPPKGGYQAIPPPLLWVATPIQIHYTGYSSLVSDLLGVLLIIWAIRGWAMWFLALRQGARPCGWCTPSRPFTAAGWRASVGQEEGRYQSFLDLQQTISWKKVVRGRHYL